MQGSQCNALTVPFNCLALPRKGASWNHHRTAAVSEGPAAASADAQSRRMIPKRVASPCRCGWCCAALRFRALLVVVPRCAPCPITGDLRLALRAELCQLSTGTDDDRRTGVLFTNWVGNPPDGMSFWPGLRCSLLTDR